MMNCGNNKIELNKMEVKQEVNENEYTCKEEIDNEGGALFDTLKVEINEEPKREATNDGFDYLVLKENSIKTEKEPYEDKFVPFEEKETRNKGFSYEDIQTDEQLFKDHVRITADMDQCLSASTNMNTEKNYFTTENLRCTIFNKESFRTRYEGLRWRPSFHVYNMH
ncbi:unnamed protein product [Diabrotica balteata]|uniref:Uncharacterized protein n=1 Tax=Diabrotica balteata TaxID=107213 RepID=A0A9N9TDC9_DIABA|nr:unnamed protein product [Diabrotica balteata]